MADEHLLDLDAARAARREKRGDPPKIRLLGKDFGLPHEMPAAVIDHIGDLHRGDFTKATIAFRALLGGPVYDELAAHAEENGDPLGIEDVSFLLRQVLEIYGVTAPKSPPSPS